METLPVQPFETLAIEALWAYTCLNKEAGALGLLVPQVDPEASRPRVWTDGRVLKISRAALHHWLGKEDIQVGVKALAQTGLMTLEAWLREPCGWVVFPSEDTSPVVALPEDEWARGFGQAIRTRLRRHRLSDLPEDVPADLQGRFEQWHDSSQRWGRGEVEDDATFSWNDRAWSVTQAQDEWRQAQVAFRQAHGPLELMEEIELTSALLASHPALLEGWLNQEPVPKADTHALFLLHDPRWIDPLVAGGALLDVEQLGDHLVSWAANQRPQLLPALLERLPEVPLPDEHLLDRVAIFQPDDRQEIAWRKTAVEVLLQRMGRDVPTASFITNALNRAFYPGSWRTHLLYECWPAERKLAEVLPELSCQWADGKTRDLPLALTLAYLAMDALEVRNATFPDTRDRLEKLAHMGVDFAAPLPQGDTVFHWLVSFARRPSTLSHLYFLFTPLGVDWNQRNDQGKTALDLPHTTLKPAQKEQFLSRFDLSSIAAHQEQLRLDKVFSTAPTPAVIKPRNRL